jgi:arylsulfatase A-like enzyme
MASGVALVFAFTAGAGDARAATPFTDTRPNIVVLFADDMGFADPGVYADMYNSPSIPRIRTPNIDAMAGQGTLFTQAYCPGPLCAASRYGLMTGLYTTHGISTNGPEITPEEITVGEVLSQAGYTTGLIGKWGLGGASFSDITNPDALPTNQGFDEFYGYLNQSRAHDYTVPWLWRSDPSDPLGVSKDYSANNIYSHDLFEAECLDFVTRNARGADPFYLQASFTIPHRQLDQVPDLGPYADAVDADGNPWPEAEKQYAAMITRLDGSIGRIMQRLRDPDGDGDTSDSVAENTLVLFASDNGTHTRDGHGEAFFNSSGPFSGRKFQLLEGGIRSPFIAVWDGHVAAGAVNSDYVLSFSDFLPTAADLAGVQSPVGIDGVSMTAALAGDGDAEGAAFISFEYNGLALRMGRWKLRMTSGGSTSLFDLEADPSESSNVASQNPDVLAEMTALLSRTATGRVQYQRWTGQVDGQFANAGNWTNPSAPQDHWIATLAAGDTGGDELEVTGDQTVLGMEVVGAPEALMHVTIGAGASLTALNGLRIAPGGAVVLNGQISTFRTVEIAGGTLSGSGLVTGNLTNDGALAPGSSPGVLTVDGDYTQSDQATLVIELAGAADEPSSEPLFDQLVITGAADLAGNVEVLTRDGFTPLAAQEWLILSADGGILGRFDAPGPLWQLRYEADGVILQVVPEPMTLSVLGLGGVALIKRRRR